MRNDENVGQYLSWSIIIYDLRSILCHQRTTDITARFRSSCARSAFGFLSSLTFGFVWKQHLDLCSRNIYISPGFNFPYFRSSPLSISPCWMASYFPVKLPRKENHFWHGLHLKSGIFHISNVWNCVENGSFWVFENWRFSGKTKVCFVVVFRHVRRQFWQSSRSLHLFTESTSGQKWTTSPRLAPQCPDSVFK